MAEPTWIPMPFWARWITLICIGVIAVAAGLFTGFFNGSLAATQVSSLVVVCSFLTPTFKGIPRLLYVMAMTVIVAFILALHRVEYGLEIAYALSLASMAFMKRE